MQHAYDDLNRQLDANPDAETAIDPYAAENPAEFFRRHQRILLQRPGFAARGLSTGLPQLKLFYRQDPLAVWQLAGRDPVYPRRLRSDRSVHQAGHGITPPICL
jgi:Mlc titration factor MtfA (ptsG expression regulator)